MNVITTFQRYTNDKLTPRFNAERKDKTNNKTMRIEITIKAFSRSHSPLRAVMQRTRAI